jgi:predicted 2-oxoglutarate/Fe(II)-dependent dioxygenase YbiX
MDYEFLDDGIFALRGFLSAEECADHIQHSEQLGYADATIQTARGAVLRKDVRNNERMLFDDQALSARFFERAQDYLPPILYDRSVCGFNDRWRFYRYTPGQQFDWHLDGVVRLRPNQQSALTFMIYLNENFEGGDTDFETDSGPLSVRPSRGMALVFPHKIRHRGAPVTSGVKYVLRSDVMYQAPPLR